MAAAAPFYLAPALTGIQPIDYTTEAGKKLYKAATAPLWKDEQYDLSAHGLFTFMESLEQRGHQYGWTNNPNGCTFVPNDPNAANLAAANITNHEFFERYAEITLERIQQWEQRMERDQMKAAQESNQIFHAVMNSLTNDARATLILEKESYEFDTDQGGGTIQGGLALLKVLTSHVVQETPGMAAILRTELNNMRDTFLKMDSDVQAFNMQVKLLVKRLNRLGQQESREDMLLQLFEAYSNAHDEDFAKYISDRKSEHDDGRNTVTYTQLMALALNKFKLLKRQGRWKSPTPTQEKIMALQVQLKEVKGQIEKGKKKVSFLQKQNKHGEDGNKKKDNQKKGKPQWLRNQTPPSKDKMKESRVWKNPAKPFYYCCKETGGQCPGRWVDNHLPSDCKYDEIMSKKKKRKATAQGQGSRGKGKAKMILAQAARAVLDQAGIDPDTCFETMEEDEE